MFGMRLGERLGDVRELSHDARRRAPFVVLRGAHTSPCSSHLIVAPRLRPSRSPRRTPLPPSELTLVAPQYRSAAPSSSIRVLTLASPKW